MLARRFYCKPLYSFSGQYIKSWLCPIGRVMLAHRLDAPRRKGLSSPQSARVLAGPSFRLRAAQQPRKGNTPDFGGALRYY